MCSDSTSFGWHRRCEEEIVDEALSAGLQELCRDAQRASLLHVVGLLMARRGRYLEAAVACLRRAVVLEPGNSVYRDDLVRVATFTQMSKTVCGDAAHAKLPVLSSIEKIRETLARDPNDIRAAILLVCALERYNLQADAAMAWYHLGETLSQRQRYHEAIVAYRQAIVRRETFTPALHDIGRTCVAAGRLTEGIRWITASLRLDPRDTSKRIDLGTAHFIEGKSELGWREFAVVYDEEAIRQLEFEERCWDGVPMHGQTLLLWTDMGRGDVIQFLRYVPIVKRLGDSRIIIRCHHQSLCPLIRRMPQVDYVIGPHEPLPRYDAHAPMILLPILLNRQNSQNGDTIPYLFAEPGLRRDWKSRLGRSNDVTVAVSWGGNVDAGNATARFMSLAELSVIGDIEGVRFVSVQHGPQAGELFWPPASLPLSGLVLATSSIDEVAAVIANCDLVISVETMVAHLAGALGKPVWMLVRHAPSWRWGDGSGSTGWYPNMHLFRQRQSGDWTDVLAEVRVALKQLVSVTRSRGSARSVSE